MTKNQNKIIFLIIGIFLGIIPTILFYNIKEFLDSWNTKPYSHSSEELINKISRFGIIVPQNAYSLDFYLDNGRDYGCWLAFSASDAEIRKTISSLEKEEKYKPTVHLPKDKVGNILIEWWPKSTKGFEIFYGHYCWMGYDKKNHRLYIYKFTT